MRNGPVVAQCPGCGKLYQSASPRPLCQACTDSENELISSIDREIRRNRNLNNEQLSALTSVPLRQIRAWIRGGRIKIYDAPNLSDSCDLCAVPIRHGKLCVGCSTRIEEAVAHEYEQDRLMKERLRNSHSYLTRAAFSR
ncbi:hypothetical protein [Cohnella sp. AR92]|uniref:hypothetical protein n=1 Tax=Cohnella sp. AR92 TaxID=648716 RepID=UPI000F8D62CE|nr:hypothetical protein [Cohnella sp. AR92]RUS45180.1 hypothetical protein ELR57_19880 [Cohnella sp. AR92]